MSDESQITSSYDTIPYESKAFYETHPDNMATLAMLAGLTPPRVEECRVLELGCAEGANLIPLALAMPESQFLGIDLSPRQIADGKKVIDSLGLKNIELEAWDIAKWEGEDQPFDYIICHGVYSWVPAEVQDKILQICKRNLSPNGVAFISFNCYPGWYLSSIVRGMSIFHGQAIDDPTARVQAARTFLDMLQRKLPDQQTPYAQVLRQEVQKFQGHSSAYLLHEHFETDNHPLHFWEFAERATGAGLRFLADARFRSMAEYQPPDIRQFLNELTDDPLRQEQYLDFLRNRTFRRTLLVHEDQTPRRTREPEDLQKFQLLATAAPAVPNPDLRTGVNLEFRTPDGRSRLMTSNALLKSALTVLADNWPSALPFQTLLEKTHNRLLQTPETSDFDRTPLALATQLLPCHMIGLIELNVFEPRFASKISERPKPSPLAALQAEAGTQVVNLRQRMVELGGFDRLVIRQLDGQRDRAAILDRLVQAVREGTFPLNRNGQPITDENEIREILDRSLTPSLQRLAGSVLLES